MESRGTSFLDAELAELMKEKLRVSNHSQTSTSREFSRAETIEALEEAYRIQLQEMHSRYVMELESLQEENNILKYGIRRAENEKSQYKVLSEKLQRQVKEMEKTIQDAKMKNYVLSVHLSQALA